ncbi:hypothetical protein ACET3Z_029241 [Daucus carota]
MSSSLLLAWQMLVITCISSCSIAFASDSFTNIHNISCPFYLRGQQHNCQNFSYELFFHNNRTSLQFPVRDYLFVQESEHNRLFYVEAIDYEKSTIRISYPAEGNYSCISDISVYTFSYEGYYMIENYQRNSPIQEYNTPMTYVDCPSPVNSSTRYIPAPPCSSSSSMSSYVVIGKMDSSEVENDCKVRWVSWVSTSWPNINQTSFLDTQDSSMMFYGIELPFHYFYCLNCSVPRKSGTYCGRVQSEIGNMPCPSTIDYSCFYDDHVNFDCGLQIQQAKAGDCKCSS